LSELLEAEVEKVEIFCDDDGLDGLVLVMLFCKIIGFRILAGGGLVSVSEELGEFALLVPVSGGLLTKAERKERTMMGPKRQGTMKFFSRIRFSSLHFITISWQQRA